MKGSMAAGVVLAVAACSVLASQPAPSVTKARNTAVGYALTLDQVTRTYAGKCGAVDRDSARLARAGWNDRNGELVRSADKYLDFVKRLLTQTQGEEAARRFYEEQKSAFAARAQLTVFDSLLSGNGEREVCAKVLDAIASGRMDVDTTPRHFKTLKEIAAEIRP